MKSIICAVWFGIASAAALAAPSIESVSGTIGSGNTVTIKGASLGNHPDYNSSSPYLCVSFENLDDGKMGDGWSGADIVSTSVNKPNSKHCTNAYGHRHSVNSPTKKLFYCHWLRLHPNTGVMKSPSQFKSMNIAYAGNTSKTYLSIACRDDGNHKWRTNTEDGQNARNPVVAKDVAPYGEWHRYSVWAVPPSAGNDLKFRVDTRILEDYGYANEQTFSSIHAISYMKGDWSKCPPYTDDHFVNYTQARVELCDSPVYGLAQVHAEIQLPKAWSASSISIDVNQGQFKDGDRAYLFVVDQNGHVSQGHEVTIGEGATPSIKPFAKSRTNGQMDEWTNGVFDILGRRVVGNGTPGRAVVIRNAVGKAAQILVLQGGAF